MGRVSEKPKNVLKMLNERVCQHRGGLVDMVCRHAVVILVAGQRLSLGSKIGWHTPKLHTRLGPQSRKRQDAK